MAKDIEVGDKVVYRVKGCRDRYYIVDRILPFFEDGKLYVQCHCSRGGRYCFRYDFLHKVEL